MYHYIAGSYIFKQSHDSIVALENVPTVFGSVSRRIIVEKIQQKEYNSNLHLISILRMFIDTDSFIKTVTFNRYLFICTKSFIDTET